MGFDYFLNVGIIFEKNSVLESHHCLQHHMLSNIQFVVLGWSLSAPKLDVEPTFCMN